MRGFLLTLVLVPAVGSSAAPPDVRAIVKRSVAVNERDFKAAPKYSYFEKDMNEELDSNGKVTSRTVKTYEVLMIEGSPYRRLVEVDGRPLSAGERAKEQQKLEETTARRRNESKEDRARRIADYQEGRKRDQVMMRQLTKAMDFTLARQDTLDGFSVWVLDASPRPDYKPPNKEAKVLTGMRGKLWIDQRTYQWVKVDAEVVEPVSIAGFLAKVEPGTRFELEKRPVQAAQNIWMPSRFTMRADYTTLFVFSHNTAEEETYFNYRPTVETAGLPRR